MCGIIGAAAQRNVVPILLEGLRRLEYRGYDSAGLATLEGQLHCLRSVGRVETLAAQARETGLRAGTGIAHTRWATHGVPSERNAHPHLSGGFAVVHNGIIENHDALRERLKKLGYVIQSDTDTEVIAHLIHHYAAERLDLLAATRRATQDLKGAYAIAVLSDTEPGVVVGARSGSPMLVGIGIEEHFLASDVSALLPVTQRVMRLEEGDFVRLTCLKAEVFDRNGDPVHRPVVISELSADVAELGEYRHFMQKEIHEQPRAVMDTLSGLPASGGVPAAMFGEAAGVLLPKVRRVHFLACGTSFHAARVACYWLEAIAGIPAQAEVASEYRYRQSVPDPEALVVAISQSGETADTLAAIEHAKALGHSLTLAICNVPESALVRACALTFMTHAGPEIGVASTKAFTTQLVGLFLLTVHLARLNGRIDAVREADLLHSLRQLPVQIQGLLGIEAEIVRVADAFTTRNHALFLGRGVQYPIAMEGALKLKEISYIHAEAYPSGELKHGPLALVDDDMPVVAVAPTDELIEKLKSNLEEVRARGGQLFVFADQESHFTPGSGVTVVRLPVAAGPLAPILFTVPLQLLAYHAALNKGTDVDKPRNLAKSVTVE